VVNILTNYACEVGTRGDVQLHCTCTGAGMTAAMALGSLVAILAVVPFPTLVAMGGTTGQGVMGMMLGAAVSLWFAYLAFSRYRRHGRFVLDNDRGTLRHYRGRRMVNEFVLRDVMRVWLVADFTDGFRVLGAPAAWLQIALCTGEVFRIAKGDQEELRPVCAVVRKLGFGPTAIIEL